MADLPNFGKRGQSILRNKSEVLANIRKGILPLTIKSGIYTHNQLRAAGFQYTGNGDAARCNGCGLEVSGWTSDMKPWTIHSTEKPRCPFVRDMRFHLSSSEIALLPRPSTTSNVKHTSECGKTEIIDYESSTNVSKEADFYRGARERSYSEWSYDANLSRSAMITAGFVSCNVHDRVVCPHCNLICQSWTPFVDVPVEVHKTLAPQCPYVKKMLSNNVQPQIINHGQTLNTNLTRNDLTIQRTTNSVSLTSQLSPSPQQCATGNESHSIYSPSTLPIDEVIKADTADPPIQHDLECTECKKSLLHTGSCNSQTADIARWLVHCTHSKQFTADQIDDEIQKYKQIQKSK